MPHVYTKDQLVEQPTVRLFAELGWTTVSALEETFSATGTLLRETNGEVVLVSRLPRRMSGLERLNPALPTEAITAAVSVICQVSPADEREGYSETRLRLGSTPYLSGLKGASVTHGFPTGSYLSRKRPA